MAREAERAREVLVGILERMGIDATIDVREEGERTLLDIHGPEAGLVIGKKGQTLEALQYLVSKVVHRDEPEGFHPIVVDSEGYRARREATLVDMAKRLGEKAVRTRTTITMNPMSPHDRRIIHITLDKVPGVTTRSEGEGIFRRLLIVPAPDKV
ncbi:MAG TPA: RNA-binding cell elongation regulator Jag/EloR [Haliangiales bacterium]|nr:RNA-binding cell elongation regulator Jag/EloR [Haliangiales bacterium]